MGYHLFSHTKLNCFRDFNSDFEDSDESVAKQILTEEVLLHLIDNHFDVKSP